MPRKPDAVVIGRMDCIAPGCAERAGVKQSIRGYFYTHCPVCGTDQRNGAPVQVYIWQHLEPLEGAVIERPRNVPEGAGPMGGALTGEAPAATVQEPERQAGSPEDTGSEPGNGGLWALAFIVGGTIAAVTSAIQG